MIEILSETITNTLTITCLVMVMLLLIEFINIRSAGKWMEQLQHKPFLQIVVATLLGLIPGCLGGFAIVSLFTHRLLSFGALIAGMISTFGDEAFVIFAYSPKWTLILSGSLVVIGIVAGWVTHLLFKHHKITVEEHSFEIHHHENEYHNGAALSIKHLKKISFPRALLIFGLLIYITAILTGTFSHQHGALPELEYHGKTETCSQEHCTNEHTTVFHEGEELQAGHQHGVFSWENCLFMILALITLVVVGLSSEHFLQLHLWQHVIKKHFIPVFLWTFGVLLFLQTLYYFVDVNTWVEHNHWSMIIILLVAVLIGIIPESGPHLIFVVMFFSGAIPFSILLA
ncbi:MAG: putative manganese transporter, partial [Bacteroidales bacterium]